MPAQPDTTNANTNERERSSADDHTQWFAVVDLCKEWDVTQPRFRRALKRKQFAPFSQERDMRRGTKTVTLLCVSSEVIPALKAFLASEELPPRIAPTSGDHARERERTQTLGVMDTNAHAYISVITQELRKQIASHEQTIADLRGDKSRMITEQEAERQERERLRTEIESLRVQVRAISPQGAVPLPPDSPHSDATPKEGEVPAKKRPWWKPFG